MCIAPALLLNGVTVACRKCWQCRENRINDWVGRNIAEKTTALAAHSITLTYGRDHDGKADHVRSALLTYSDVQKYIRSLRDTGYPLRYFVAGEYGSEKGRAHWHLMAYWTERVPEHTLAIYPKDDSRNRFMQEHWPHGWSHWEKPETAAVRYVCKYIQKDDKRGRQGHVSMSKKPPLGTQYFDRLALNHVRQGLSPQEPHYAFPDVNGKDGEKILFYLKGAPLDGFLAAFVDYWLATYRSDRWPQSDLVDDFIDRRCQTWIGDFKLEPLSRRLVYPWREPPTGLIHFDEKRNAYASLQVDGTVLYWSYDQEGNRSWQDVIRTERGAVSARSANLNAERAGYRDASGR